MGECHARSIDFPLSSLCLILCAACLYGACLPLRYLHVRRLTEPICFHCPFRAWSFFLSVTKAPCRLWRRPPNWPKDSLKGGQNAVSMRQRWLPTPQPPMKILPAPWINCWGRAGNAARVSIPAGRIFISWSGKPQAGINVFTLLQPGMRFIPVQKAASTVQCDQYFHAIQQAPFLHGCQNNECKNLLQIARKANQRRTPPIDFHPACIYV